MNPLDENEIIQGVANAVISMSASMKALGTGNAVTDMGAIEFLATQVREGLESVSFSLDKVAEAIRESKE